MPVVSRKPGDTLKKEPLYAPRCPIVGSGGDARLTLAGFLLLCRHHQEERDQDLANRYRFGVVIENICGVCPAGAMVRSGRVGQLTNKAMPDGVSLADLHELEDG